MNVVRIWPRGRPRHPDILTPAEWRVAAGLRRGYSNAEIAGELGISVNTVRTHVSHMLRKLEVPDRRALAELKVLQMTTPIVEYLCSFCGRNQDQVKRLIAGPGTVYICDECVGKCNGILAEHPARAG